MQDRYQLFETIERLTGKTLVESELDEICRLFDDKTPIKKEGELGKIYAAPINGDWYAVFVGDKKLTLHLSESDAKTIANRYNGFEELSQENKRLALQVEVLSAAFANSSHKEKSLMEENERIRAEYASLLDVCKKIASEESVIKRESHILDLCNVLDEF